MINPSINAINTDHPSKDMLQDKKHQSLKKVKISTRKRGIFLILILVISVLCLFLVLTSVLSNYFAPSSSQIVAHLDTLQKARLAEALQLRRNLGDQIWPKFGQMEIPMIVWNESYAFLVGLENPPAGWITIPSHTQQGNAWAPVPGDNFFGQPYYRQLLPVNGAIPQAFTTLIGDQWAAGITTREWMLISLSELVRQDFGPIFPHWLFARIGMGSTERYIGPGLLHESFHAYQGMTAPQRLEAAERANIQWADSYPWTDETFQDHWRTELNLLRKALQAESDLEAASLTRDFLILRATRRTQAGLTPAQIEFERQREWVEGLAKYTDLSIWQLAYTSDYKPIPEILRDPDFDSYSGFPGYWKIELSNLVQRASDEGDGRFYYTGMAQAFLLDRLMPEWKSLIFQEGVWLDDLLQKSID